MQWLLTTGYLRSDLAGEGWGAGSAQSTCSSFSDSVPRTPVSVRKTFLPATGAAPGNAWVRVGPPAAYVLGWSGHPHTHARDRPGLRRLSVSEHRSLPPQPPQHHWLGSGTLAGAAARAAGKARPLPQTWERRLHQDPQTAGGSDSFCTGQTAASCPWRLGRATRAGRAELHVCCGSDHTPAHSQAHTEDRQAGHVQCTAQPPRPDPGAAGCFLGEGQQESRLLCSWSARSLEASSWAPTPTSPAAVAHGAAWGPGPLSGLLLQPDPCVVRSLADCLRPVRCAFPPSLDSPPTQASRDREHHTTSGWDSCLKGSVLCRRPRMSSCHT